MNCPEPKPGGKPHSSEWAANWSAHALLKAPRAVAKALDGLLASLRISLGRITGHPEATELLLDCRQSGSYRVAEPDVITTKEL